MPIITLTTDFGVADPYVAAMKGVIWSIAPDVKITDVTHEIPPQDVDRAAFVLRQVWTCFPPGTIHVAVVDPGVGSKRAILLGRYEDRFVVAPDNGLVTWVHHDFAGQSLYAVENADYQLPNAASTFQGRDVMGPAAAHLARGVSPQRFGRPVCDPRLLDIQHRASRRGDGLVGAVIHIDRFGNLVTNIHADQVGQLGCQARELEVVVNGKGIGSLQKTFCDVAVGESVAMIGSARFVEVGVRNGNAAARFVPGADVDLVVEIRPHKAESTQR